KAGAFSFGLVAGSGPQPVAIGPFVPLRMHRAMYPAGGLDGSSTLHKVAGTPSPRYAFVSISGPASMGIVSNLAGPTFRDCICVRCKQVNHDWRGCKCAACGQSRGDVGHEFHNCVCTICGLESHKWQGCKCTACGQVRDTEHSWNGAVCQSCGVHWAYEH